MSAALSTGESNAAFPIWKRVIPVALFFLVMGVAWCVAAIFVNRTYGWRGVEMASLSWLCVVVGGLVSLVVSAWFAGSAQSSLANMFGLLPRMFVPLVGLIGFRSVADWSEMGGPGMLLAFYIVGLIVETILTVKYFTPHNGKLLAAAKVPQA
jgi:uncharacterized membrane protein